jgi:acyl-CoA dehydrogenase
MFELDPAHCRLLEEAEQIGSELAGREGPAAPGEVDRGMLAELGRRGLLGRLFPAGDEVPALELCLLRQGLARTCVEAEELLAVHGLGSYPIYQSATDEQRAMWMGPLAAGEMTAAFALTEPGAGSDAANLALAAKPDGDAYRLTGEKIYISNAPDADLYVVFARTTPGAGARGVSAFVVPREAAGLAGERIDLISSHPIGRLVFDGVAVTRREMLGEPNQGFRVAMRTLDLFRPSVGAAAVGMGEAAMRLAVGHATEREAFGQPIASFQAVSHQLAAMAVELEASRLLVYRAAAAHRAGRDEEVTGLAAAAKLYATETAQRVIDAAIQIHGARALERTHPLARLYQEVRAPRIYEGTSEIQRNIIAREVLRGRSLLA